MGAVGDARKRLGRQAQSAEIDAPAYKCFVCAEPVDSVGFDADGYWHGASPVRVIPPGVDQ